MVRFPDRVLQMEWRAGLEVVLLRGDEGVKVHTGRANVERLPCGALANHRLDV